MDNKDKNKFEIGGNDIFPKSDIPTGNEIGPNHEGFNLPQMGNKNIKEMPPGGFNMDDPQNIQFNFQKPATE